MPKHNNHRPGNANNPSKGKESHVRKTRKSGGKGSGRGGNNGGRR